jgi:hypothetical protein
MSTPPGSGSATMRPRARLIRLIGDELISDEPVALVELVKNAYDADATRVTVRFEADDRGRVESIVVEDNGIGMDLRTVLEGWFEPGTILKRETERSPGGRLYQGAKGIGRFACARLAEWMLLESKKAELDQGVVVLLDWGRFEDESYLDEIDLEYEVRPIPDLQKGTRLTLEGVRRNGSKEKGVSKAWERGDFEELHSRLSRLLSPFADVTEFSIYLDISGYPEFSGEVQPPELVLRPKYCLRGRLDDHGRFSGEMRSDGRLRKKFTARQLGEAGDEPPCGPFEVEIRAWDRDRPGLAPLMERYAMGIGEIRRTLDNYCGVAIYRDGFRVYPYGEKKSDWLGLDLRSRQNPPKNLANNQVVAAIRISRERNPNLRDRSTREGMVRNREHTALESWFKEVLSLLESERYDLRPREEATEEGQPLFESFDFSETAEETRKQLGKDHPVAKLVTDAEKQIREGVRRVEAVFSRLLMSAGLGHMVDIVIHEIGAPLGKVNRQLAILEQHLKKQLNPEAEGIAAGMLESLKGWLTQIHNLRQRLEPQTPAKRGRATVFDVRDEVEDDFALYEALLAKHGIAHEIQSPQKGVKVKMSRACLGQILVNLIDNSIYWISRHRETSKGGRIYVEIQGRKGGFRIRFCDDGPGIQTEDAARVFDPYFTRKPNGMGLGLYIARLIIEPYGKLVCTNDCALSGACFEAVFERGVGR